VHFFAEKEMPVTHFFEQKKKKATTRQRKQP